MDVPLLNEHYIHRFKFYSAGEILDGMSWKSELYQCESKLSVHYRDQAYAVALNLAEQNYRVVISTDNEFYTVWVSLRSFSQQNGEHNACA